MTMNRRKFLQATGVGLGGALLSPESVFASDASGQASMLYDATMCIGCRACSKGCRSWNQTPVEKDASGLYDAPRDLSGDTWTIIKYYQGEGEYSFVKRQCMHCLHPACVSVCPVQALQKSDAGPVIYESERCLGCRYCMMACPFRIPRYQWEKTLPLVRKCTFCADRLEQGLGPACAEACPTGALIHGQRGALLEAAEARLRDNPGRYVQQVYGKEQAGGTSVLYLSHVPFEKLGFPVLTSQALPKLTERAMLAVPGIIVGVGGLMSGIYWFTKRRVAMRQEG